ncbi:alpha/beta hydrolase [Microbacterium hominis]|uniref:Alpha/beta hydrolase n=1 Tax=Microbacterium hominis TaxID=162426 RepID=A0A7D4Q108_9MICO|nr:alpha/beta hydrolase [Microbacterium hominis]QKJ18551.1 alpha/beta hydrolase [Microbacterium hominis]
MPDDWVADLLGKPFEQRTLDLGAEGAREGLVATLVRSIPNPVTSVFAPLRDVDVLYVHGWSDYFFQTGLAQFFTRRGARFHALDLHRYGRSLREGQIPGYMQSLADYDADIEAALTAMGHGVDAAPRRRLVLLGHSTGGLTLTLWAARHPGRAQALVLNSPWLELQVGAIGRQAIAPLVEVRARLDPRGSHPAVDLGFYTRAQRDVGALPVPGYRDDWRPEFGFPTHPGWLAAVLEGHRRVAAGLDVGCPALVMLSARSSPPIYWQDAMRSSDSVLVVDDIAKAAVRIGSLVTVARIDGALHDVFLSAPDPRAHAYEVMARWLAANANGDSLPR